METIKCCKNCQKRNTGCHSSCSDYIIEKVFYEADKAERDKKKQIADGLFNQRDNSIRKYFKSTKNINGRKA